MATHTHRALGAGQGAVKASAGLLDPRANLFVSPAHEISSKHGQHRLNADIGGTATHQMLDLEGGFLFYKCSNFEFPSEYGSGCAKVRLDPPNIDFGNQTVGTTSFPQQITLTNIGAADLDIINIRTSGDFDQTNTCPNPLPSTSSCFIDVTFTPTVGGVRTGNLVVTSNAASSPDTVPLSGNGPAVDLDPLNIDFGKQTIGTTSSPQQITLTNTGAADLDIINIGTSGGFDQTNICPDLLPPTLSCFIDVTFTPTAGGVRTSVPGHK